MTSHRFDEQLASFLRWQSAQTAGAPSAEEMALRLPHRAQTHRTAWRLGLAAAVVVASVALAGITLALVAGLRSTAPPVSFDGPLAFNGQACGLAAIDPVTGETEVIAGPVDGCPGRDGTDSGAFAGLIYQDVGGSADGRLVVYSRLLFCGGCGSTPTKKALAAQGAYVFDRDTGLTERLDDCLGGRCWFRVAISPDGRYIAYAQDPYQATATTGPTPVTILDRETETRSVLEGRNVTSFAWSHRSRALAIVQARTCDPAVVDYCSSLADEVIVASPDGTSRRSVATLDGETTLAWSSDDRSLLTLTVGPALGGAPTSSTSAGRIDLASGEMSRLFTVNADPGTASWSPDATRLAYRVSDATGDRGEVHIVDVDGADVTPAVMNDVVLGPPRWSPSGGSILFDGAAIPSPDAPSIADSYVLRLADGEMGVALATTGVVAWLPGRP